MEKFQAEAGADAEHKTYCDDQMIDSLSELGGICVFEQVLIFVESGGTKSEWNKLGSCRVEASCRRLCGLLSRLD